MSDRPDESATPGQQNHPRPAAGIPVGSVREHEAHPGETAGGAAASDQAKAEAAGLLGQAKDRAEDLVEDGKTAGAAHATGLARAIQHAADELEGSSPDIARHVRAAGDSIKGIAEAMRERSAGQLLEDVSDFARRQPTLFFGAAAMAGFALVRFARSSAEGAPRPARMARATPGGAVAHRDAEAGPESHPAGSPSPQGLSMPVLRSGSVPNERSESPL